MRDPRERRNATVPLNSFNIHVLIYQPIRAPTAFKFSLSPDCWKSTNELWAVCFMKVSSLVISAYLATRTLHFCHLSFLYISTQYFCLFSLSPRRFVPDCIRFTTKPFACTNSVSCNISCLKSFNLVSHRNVNQIYKLLNIVDISLTKNNPAANTQLYTDNYT